MYNRFFPAKVFAESGGGMGITTILYGPRVRLATDFRSDSAPAFTRKVAHGSSGYACVYCRILRVGRYRLAVSPDDNPGVAFTPKSGYLGRQNSDDDKNSDIKQYLTRLTIDLVSRDRWRGFGGELKIVGLVDEIHDQERYSDNN